MDIDIVTQQGQELILIQFLKKLFILHITFPKQVYILTFYSKLI